MRYRPFGVSGSAISNLTLSFGAAALARGRAAGLDLLYSALEAGINSYRLETADPVAAEVLGASTFQYWRMVALPILFPSLLGTFALLFANSFGAVATAYALTGSSLSIVPIMLFAQIRGDVLQDPHLGYAMAFGMIVITGLANLAYVVMRARAERWLR